MAPSQAVFVQRPVSWAQHSESLWDTAREPAKVPWPAVNSYATRMSHLDYKSKIRETSCLQTVLRRIAYLELRCGSFWQDRKRSRRCRVLAWLEKPLQLIYTHAMCCANHLFGLLISSPGELSPHRRSRQRTCCPPFLPILLLP